MFTVDISQEGTSFSLIYEDERTKVVITSDIDSVGDIYIKSDKGEWFTKFNNGWLELTWNDSHILYVVTINTDITQRTSIKMIPEVKDSFMNAIAVLNGAITARQEYMELFS